jgi:transcriptional regulator with XRE-family HTH domain
MLHRMSHVPDRGAGADPGADADTARPGRMAMIPALYWMAMETFGQRLSQALELSGLPLEQVAKATGLGIEQIRALERDDFSALPDDDQLTQGLKSLARILEVDPDQVIADFRRQREQTSPLLNQESSEPPARRRVRVAVPTLVILAGAIAIFLFWPRGSQRPGPAPASAVVQQTAAVKAPVKETRGTADSGGTPQAAAHARPSAPRPPEPAIERIGGDSGPTIPESGIGTGILDHDLVGRTDQFTEGERACFWTRVEGGAAGETIDHVWIHDGAEALRVEVRLGGAHWRTHSYKVLNAGSAGDWIVEARDKAGRLLARSEFSCSRRPGGA